MCANRLAGTVGDQVSITLVNPIEDFVERIRLHEVAAGRGPQTATRHALASLLHPTVRLRIAAATLIRPDASVVDCVTRFGQALSEPYDRLVYAVGSGAPAGTVPADCVVWAASFAVPDLAARSGLGVDGAGRLVVDEAMRATDHPGVLGDGVVLLGPVGRHSRMACATAAPQGAHAAQTIIHGLRGEQPAAFAPNSLVLSMSLGPGDGLIQTVHGDDTPRDLTLTGRAGAVFNELNNRRYARAIRGRLRRRAGSYRRSRPRIATYREESRHAG
jgi:NADH dehydrogenase FAD-containing subunit